MKIPKLLQAVLVLAFVYFGFIVVFDYILDAVIPSSLLAMYMFFVAAGVFMVFTYDEEGTRELVAPVKAMVEDPSKRLWRNVVFVILPLAVGGGTYMKMLPNFEAPLELRTIHPAPPSTAKIYGKRVNFLKLENPYRKIEKEDPEAFRELVNEGAAVYIENCQYCHGDKLDGNGPYAAGLNPTPLNFQDVGTIAQLQESYLFWRITTGGPGLPKEAAPWISSMPVWQDFLKEDEVWKVILFLYDYTGHRPRSWEHE
ncbi:MAG: cytochrome c [Alphaproteobacteria bacterium]|mgnify:FL=1|jgi:mono/diheme cytochrome c family protein|nr:cytochrome c [Alphaproteobacteria bacterium]MBT4084229.1 cytochrome c [Alphaproteobacteria bacterium]MBT4543568.1 cytochrome c [Alphaproteobacteria bacterium]MBT5919133.1 cytochrome c [Alphaproteobacteria bacterium]MBT7745706.1 cytochrome c [Alphaproteobacteria bacterium]